MHQHAQTKRGRLIANKLANQKLMAASINIKMAGYRIDETDCMHNSLPLYHSTGLMLGLCAVIQAGASTFIKRKFSASSFWDEVQQYNTTALVYIGPIPTAGVLVLMAGAVAFVTVAVKKRPDRIQTSANHGPKGKSNRQNHPAHSALPKLKHRDYIEFKFPDNGNQTPKAGQPISGGGEDVL